MSRCRDESPPWPIGLRCGRRCGMASWGWFVTWRARRACGPCSGRQPGRRVAARASDSVSEPAGHLLAHPAAAATAPFAPLFFALSLENNHSADYGAAPRRQLAAQLRDLKISALTDEEDAPVTLLRRGPITWALVAVNLINRSADDVDATLLRLRLRLGLTRAHTPWVVVPLHWGREYDPHAGPLETKLSELFLPGARA